MSAVAAQYIKYTPSNEEDLVSKFHVVADNEEDHGDIIDYERVIPFEAIPLNVKQEITERYDLAAMDEEELESFKGDFMCKAFLSFGLSEERGFEVHCNNIVYYLIGSSEEAQFTTGQGAFNKMWLNEIHNQLEELGWKPESVKQNNKQHHIPMSDTLRISVLEHSEDHYELAVQHKPWSWSDWEMDYNIFSDVLTARSTMEVYGKCKDIFERYSAAYPNTPFLKF